MYYHNDEVANLSRFHQSAAHFVRLPIENMLGDVQRSTTNAQGPSCDTLSIYKSSCVPTPQLQHMVEIMVQSPKMGCDLRR